MADSKHWTEHFRWLTPILVTIAIATLTGLRSDISNFKADIKYQLTDIESKLFKHLTNDEIHSPRSQTVSKAEYDAHCKEKEKIVDRIYEELVTMRQEIQRIK